MRHTRVLLIALLIAGPGLFTQELLAQSNNLARIYFVEARTGHGAELEAAIKEHAAWRKQQGDPWTWVVHEVANGDNLGDFVIRSGNHTWADFDAYDAGFGPKGGVRFNETVGPHIESVTSAITMVDTTNVRWPENPDDVNLLSVETYYLKPGQGDVFTRTVNKVHQAIVAHNRPGYYAFEWNLNGPDGEAVSLILPHKNWADFQGPDESLGAFLVRVMGEQEAGKVFEQFASTYHASKSWVVRVRRDLSVLPQM